LAREWRLLAWCVTAASAIGVPAAAMEDITSLEHAGLEVTGGCSTLGYTVPQALGPAAASLATAIVVTIVLKTQRTRAVDDATRLMRARTLAAAMPLSGLAASALGLASVLLLIRLGRGISLSQCLSFATDGPWWPDFAMGTLVSVLLAGFLLMWIEIECKWLGRRRRLVSVALAVVFLVPCWMVSVAAAFTMLFGAADLPDGALEALRRLA
jgi:hypothetical protein